MLPSPMVSCAPAHDASAATMDAQPASSSKVRTRIAIAILLLFAAAVISLDWYGRTRRSLSPRSLVIEVASPEETYEAWRRSGVRGRTLILFGAFPHLWRTSYAEGAPPPGPKSFVELAALDNLVRRVYFLLPDEGWDTTFGQELPGFFRKVPGLRRGMYMHYSLGLPVIATTPSSLPSMSEPALVYVDRGRFDLAFVQALLARKGITTDVLVVSNGM